MRIVRYDAGAGPRYGELVNGTVHEWAGDLFGPRQRSGRTHVASGVRVLPPVVPSKFILASLNYQEVVTQLGYPRPKSPILFLKAPSALVADGGDIHYPAASGTRLGLHRAAPPATGASRSTRTRDPGRRPGGEIARWISD